MIKFVFLLSYSKIGTGQQLFISCRCWHACGSVFRIVLIGVLTENVSQSSSSSENFWSVWWGSASWTSSFRPTEIHRFFFCLGLLYTERLGKSRNKEVHWDLRERSPRDFTGGKEWVQRGPKILTGKAKSTVILFRSIKLFSLSFLLPRLPLQNFGKCDKFTSFAQCSKRNKRNMQIEIPGKVREEGQYLFSTPPNYYTFYYLVPARAHHSYRKTLFQPHLTHFLIFGIFYYDRLNSDDFIT